MTVATTTQQGFYETCIIEAKEYRDANGIVDAAGDRLYAQVMAGRTNPVNLDGGEIARPTQGRGAFGSRTSVSHQATEKQINFIVSLLNERVEGGFDGDAYKAALADLDKPVTKEQASKMIKHLLSVPKVTKNTVEVPVTKTARVEVEAGIYLIDGDVVKVQKAVHGSGNMYAKRLVVDAPGAKGRFEYAPGLIRKVTPEARMTLDQAVEYGAIYGVCCNCGRTLTDEKSIEAGIGPVCAKRF